MPAPRSDPAASVPEVTPDVPSTTWRTVLALLRRLPEAGMSRSVGRLADLPLPRPVRKPVLGLLARTLDIDMDEAEKPLEEYGSLSELFVRRLKEGRRTWPEREDAAGSPVDGVVGQVGRVASGRALQAKGRSYSVAELLDDEEAGERYDGGTFVTLYLAPRHYHRIHAPTGGTIREGRHVPGALLPVNGPAVAHVPDLFVRNERLVCPVDGPLGRVAVVAVGAYNVGRISAAFDPAWAGDDGKEWITNRKEPVPRHRVYRPPVEVSRGEEVMAFHLGSTVVLVFEPGRVRLTPRCEPGTEVRLGEALAVAASGEDVPPSPSPPDPE